jgi:hypothetical protein
MIKKFLRPFTPQFVVNMLKKRFDKAQLKEWYEKGCPVPPPHIVKQMTILEYKNKSQYEVLVETGTYKGDMVEAQKRNFREIFSIELGMDLFRNAKKRFEGDKSVSIVQGDSGKMLHEIVLRLNEPAIFWLDGHYSGGITAKGEKECHIYEELDAIFDSRQFNHVLLIDDARLFTGEGDYPTINNVTEFIKNKNEKYQVEIKHDIIRCVV